MKKIIILFLLIFGFYRSQAVDHPSVHETTISPNERGLIARLDALEQAGDFAGRDSMFDAYTMNAATKEETISDELYAHYFRAGIFQNKKAVLKQAQNWAYACEKEHQAADASKAYLNWSKILLYFKDQELALSKAERAIELAHAAKDKFAAAEALIGRADILVWENKKSDAFRDYLDAYYDALELKNYALTQKSLEHIAELFVNSKLYGQALKYRKEQLGQFLKGPERNDSSTYYGLLLEIADNKLDKGSIREGSADAEKVLSYCLRHNNRQLLTKQLAVLRSNYFETNNFEGLIDLYGNRFPGELDSLKPSNPIAYFRIRALQREQKGDLLAAAEYLDSAELYLPADKSTDFISANFFIRKGEFYLRCGFPARAMPYFEQAYAISAQTHYFPFLKTASQNLDLAATALGDYKKAHDFRGKTLAWSDSLRQMVDNDAIVLLEFESLEKQKELSEKQHQEQVDRKHNLQYMLIIILIVSSFILLIVLGSVRIPEIVIKSLGYLVFIFFFEFLILLADNKIHHMTHGEPLKIMGFKIVLIALMLPLHHWVEHKVVHFLLHHKLLSRSGKNEHQKHHSQEAHA
jgi:hypothetical protein